MAGSAPQLLKLVRLGRRATVVVSQRPNLSAKALDGCLQRMGGRLIDVSQRQWIVHAVKLNS
eukprot:2506065-Rhodomonas_salina.1